MVRIGGTYQKSEYHLGTTGKQSSVENPGRHPMLAFSCIVLQDNCMKLTRISSIVFDVIYEVVVCALKMSHGICVNVSCINLRHKRLKLNNSIEVHLFDCGHILKKPKSFPVI